ncbi:MAG: ribonuclease III [Betaproteobacteria bacterium]
MPDGPIERRLGYRFSNAALLKQALTHRSHGVPHNERLEFLGDGLLNFVVARLLFQHFTGLPEGDLSRLRAGLVNQQALSELAVALDLGAHLRMGEGELKSGGFRRPSILADAFEALVGALYLDGGFAVAEQVLGAQFAPLLANIDPGSTEKDPKTRLQEYLQGRKLALPQYSILSIAGEAHEQFFRVECAIGQLSVRAQGEGASRRAAEQEAARQAYELAISQS